MEANKMSLSTVKGVYQCGGVSWIGWEYKHIKQIFLICLVLPTAVIVLIIFF